MAELTLDEMIDKLAGEVDQTNQHLPTGAAALADQLVAEARDLCADVGLDLNDPHHAEMVVRVAFAMVRVGNKVMAKELEAAWIGVASSPLKVRLHTHVKAVAVQRIAWAALGTLTVPDVPPVTPPKPEPWWRGKWGRRAR